MGNVERTLRTRLSADGLSYSDCRCCLPIILYPKSINNQILAKQSLYDGDFADATLKTNRPQNRRVS